MDGRRIRVWLSLFGGESGAAVAEEKEANGSRLRPNRNSIDLVRWCQAIHLAPSVRRRVFYGSASRFPRFSTALPRLRPSLGAGRGREKKTGQLSGRPPNCSLITVPVARTSEPRAVAALQSSRSTIPSTLLSISIRRKCNFILVDTQNVFTYRRYT